MNSLPYSVATLLKCRHFRDSSLGQRNEKGRANSGHAKAVHSAAATVARCYLVGSLLSCLCVCFALGIALEQRSQTRGSRAACGPAQSQDSFAVKLPPAASRASYPGCCLSMRFLTRAACFPSMTLIERLHTATERVALQRSFLAFDHRVSHTRNENLQGGAHTLPPK